MQLKRIILPLVFIVFGVILFSSYSWWNNASPEKTCASCHEISPSVHSFAQSSHRDLKCSECHGTALSNGIHSLQEKGRMVINHFRPEDVKNIRMSEEQLLAVMDNCQRCHTEEYAGWQAGAHSVTYAGVFLNEEHNRTEQINFDCLRCHGMFYEGFVDEIVTPINIEGPWHLLDETLSERPAIPCMACHQVHRPGSPVAELNHTVHSDTLATNKIWQPMLTFYERHDQMYLAGNDLPVVKVRHNGEFIKVSEDPRMRTCIQCHAPNAFMHSGSSDDMTPRGVHEGLSCMSCHAPHTGNTANSCITCHPAISNCGLEVTKMNTTFSNPDSPFDIHFVSCEDCHGEEGFDG